MTDHLTAAILAAARLDDATAADQLGYVVDLDNPFAIAHATEGRPSLRASMERGGYLHPGHDDASAIDLLLRAQTEADPERLYARLARRGFPLLADVAQRSREALDARMVGEPPTPAFVFDDLPPDVARAAGILGGWIDPAAEARRDVAAKARALMAAGDLVGAVGVLVASFDANGSPVETP